MVKAKAAVFHETDKPMTIETFNLGAPQSGWALIKMEASGVCGTDVHQFKGRIATQTPIVLGHEMAGVVEEIADSDSEKFGVKKGDHVLTSVAVPCGECALCKMGGEANCLNFGCTYVHNPYEAPHLFGGYSEYAYFPAGNLFKVPAGLPIKTAAVFACGGPTVLNAFKPVTASGFANITTAVVQGLGRWACSPCSI